MMLAQKGSQLTDSEPVSGDGPLKDVLWDIYSGIQSSPCIAQTVVRRWGPSLCTLDLSPSARSASPRRLMPCPATESTSRGQRKGDGYRNPQESA